MEGSEAVNASPGPPPDEDLRGAGVVLCILAGAGSDEGIAGLDSRWKMTAKYLRARPPENRRSAFKKWLDGRDPAEAERVRSAMAEAERLGLGVARADEEEGEGEDEDEDAAAPVERWPAPPSPEAYHGVMGDLVRKIDPHTQADPLAVLGQAIVMFGNVLGRTAKFKAEADEHHCNEYVGLVGPTSRGAKGSSFGQVRRIFQSIDPDWATRRILRGLATGEGLIWAVRDPIEKDEPIREKAGGKVVGYQKVTHDFGVDDKRLLVHESEFANLLRQKKRDGNILDVVLRNAWDGIRLETNSKTCPAHATGAHVSLIGHITKDELNGTLARGDASNGFVNRFVWLAVRRSKSLPFGGQVYKVDFAPEVNRIREAVDFARKCGEVVRSHEANALWASVYGRLDEDRPGLLGAVLARAVPHVMRLATMYALLDLSGEIYPEHLNAALALWDYAERSAQFIFGASLGDPDAEKLLAAIRKAPGGLSREDIRRDVFQGHKPSPAIAALLSKLDEQGLAHEQTVKTTGRPKKIWRPGRGDRA